MRGEDEARAGSRPGAPVDPILTVDVEDWFHVCGHPIYSDPSTWEGRAGRVHVGVEAVLNALSETSSKATFFVLGWVARKSPALVRQIASAGHEVGCHGDLHRRVFEITLEEFREDVRRSRDTIRDALGTDVTAFRAPEWSMRSPDNPALAILVEEGFQLDSSLVAAPPVGRSDNPQTPAWIETPAGRILEVPPLIGSFFFRKAMLGGGVCSRLSRLSRVVKAIDRSRVEGHPPVLYLHPWELDADHPPMSGLSAVGRLVHFAGRRRALPRLMYLLGRYRFVPISSAWAAASIGAAA